MWGIGQVYHFSPRSSKQDFMWNIGQVYLLFRLRVAHVATRHGRFGGMAFTGLLLRNLN